MSHHRRANESHHHAYATQFTRTGKLNMQNRKPYRTAGQKAEARRTAWVANGTFRSNAPVSIHSAPRGKRAA